MLHSPLPVLVDQLGDRLVCLVHQLAPRVEDVRDARVEGLPASKVIVIKWLKNQLFKVTLHEYYSVSTPLSNALQNEASYLFYLSQDSEVMYHFGQYPPAD